MGCVESGSEQHGMRCCRGEHANAAQQSAWKHRAGGALAFISYRHPCGSSSLAVANTCAHVEREAGVTL